MVSTPQRSSPTQSKMVSPTEEAIKTEQVMEEEQAPPIQPEAEYPQEHEMDLSAAYEGHPHLPPALPDVHAHEAVEGAEAEVLPQAPLSPRYARTTQLLTRFPGLSIPEAMRAAKYTLEESFDPALQEPVEEFLVHNPVKKEKRTRRPPGSQEAVGTIQDASLIEIDPSKLPPDIVISSVRPKNASGRCLCRVEGCRKLDQANNDGFCRAHYNLIRLADESVDDGADGEGEGEPWTCDCGCKVSPRQKRCGSCHRWKDGIRQPSTSPKAEKIYVLKDPGLTWECTCGNLVPEPKSRCGKCHHWKGGKRMGGWKLGAKSENNVQVDDIDRSEDWECCGEALSSKKTRCGKCRRWRGGKRQVRWSYGAKSEGGASGQTYQSVEEEGVDPTQDWVCKVESCKMVNRGGKKRCSSCFSWRFSRKRVRVSTGSMEHAVETEDMALDQLDALVKEGGEVGEGVAGDAQVVEGDEALAVAVEAGMEAEGEQMQSV